MKLLSTAFEEETPIPAKYTGEGPDLSPPLQIEDVPKGTHNFALVMDDPDAPMGTFDHWIAWNIPGESRELREGASFSHQGKNHFGKIGYNGPMPPPGTPHRYYFKIFALKNPLNLPEGSSKEELLEAIEGQVLDSAELMGTYQRS